MVRFREVVCFGVLSCAAVDAHAQLALAPGVLVPAPTRPSGVAIADLNGDGFGDLAVTTDDPDKISLFTGSATGALTPAGNVPLGAGVGAQDIAATDLDGDGDNDFVVVFNNTGAIRAVINDGNLNFTLGTSAATGPDPRGLWMANLDADTDMDFAVANREGNNVTVILNEGGTLSSMNFPAGAEPRAVAAGDFDADGDNDLAVTNHDAPNVQILVNSGAGVFTGGAVLGVGPFVRPQGISAGDLDGDGDVDLAVTLDDDDRNIHVLGVYLNNAGVFAGPTNFETGGSNPDSVVLADFDLDEDLDAAVTNQDSNTMALLENLGAGTFAAPQVVPTGTRPGTLATGDLDGNTTPDIVVANRDSNDVSVFINLAEPKVPCRADFNGDNAVNSQDYFDFLTVFFNNDAAADFNADGFINSQDYFDFLTVFFAGCP